MMHDVPFTDQIPWWFKKATDCHICHKPFNETDFNKRKVLDHDHFTGKIMGAAHSDCNLQRRKSFQIPVFFHNFRGYDSHFIVQAFSDFPEIPIKPIAQTMEKYLASRMGPTHCLPRLSPIPHGVTGFSHQVAKRIKGQILSLRHTNGALLRRSILPRAARKDQRKPRSSPTEGSLPI